jgi:hypothetical protein
MTKRVRLFSYATDDIDTAGQKALPYLQYVETEINKLTAIIPDWQAIEAKMAEHLQLITSIKSQIGDAASEQDDEKIAKLLSIISKSEAPGKPEQDIPKPPAPASIPAKNEQEVGAMKKELESVINEGDETQSASQPLAEQTPEVQVPAEPKV